MLIGFGMSTSLLVTKLYIPRDRCKLVSRRHLVDIPRKQLGGRRTRISAPAGSGKTMLFMICQDGISLFELLSGSDLNAEHRVPLSRAGDCDPSGIDIVQRSYGFNALVGRIHARRADLSFGAGITLTAKRSSEGGSHFQQQHPSSVPDFLSSFSSSSPFVASSAKSSRDKDYTRTRRRKP
jgi:hypothetical protein